MFLSPRYLFLFSVSLGLHLVLLFIPLSSAKLVVQAPGYLVDTVARQVASFVPSREVSPIPLVKNVPLSLGQGKSSSQNRLDSASIPHVVKEKFIPAAAASVSDNVPIPPLPTPEEAIPEVVPQSADGGGLSEIVAPRSKLTAVDVADLSDSESPVMDAGLAVVTPAHSGRGDTQALPRYVENPQPRYPDVARRKGWSGIVEIGVRVNTSGRVVKLSIVQSSGFSVLDRAARRAVRLWKFVPATRSGHNVVADVVVPIDFRLPETDGSQGLVAE